MQIVAILACLIAGLLGAASVIAHASTLQTVMGYVTLVWVLSWAIINKAYTREYWTYVHQPIKDIIRNSPVPSALTRVAGFGMVVLVALDTYVSFFN